MSKEKVLVGMSGGVDSSVAAVLLLEKGYDVAGLTITPFKIDSDCRINTRDRSCCSFQSVIDANDVCKILGIEHYLVDMTEAFRKNIVENFVNEYLSGRTPNPCIKCNPSIKWGGMLEKADSIGAKYVASGHYAKVNYNPDSGRYYLSKGFDKSKDQSYFLWKMSQEQLSRTLFPLENLVKNHTRELALRFNLPVHSKPESQEICFIPDNNYRNFLKKWLDSHGKEIDEGNIVMNGTVLGKHDGYPYYTIGQRKGLGVSHKESLYVKDIDPATNTIEVGTETELSRNRLSASDLNIMKYDVLDETKTYKVKIRYRDSGSDAYCKILDNGQIIIDFLADKRAITPGQSVVIYEGDDLVGGGIING